MIRLPVTPDLARFSTRVELVGAPYVLRWTWWPRAARWCVDLGLPDGEWLWMREPMGDQPLFDGLVDRRRPLGLFRGYDLDPRAATLLGRYDLGSRLVLYFFDALELATEDDSDGLHIELRP